MLWYHSSRLPIQMQVFPQICQFTFVFVLLFALHHRPILEKLSQMLLPLPSVKAVYQAPDAKFTDNLYLIGSSIQTPWQSWKPIPQVQGVAGNYYGIVYLPAGGEFKWGTENNDYRGINRLKEINDEAGAVISAGEEQNIKVANAGWYTPPLQG